MNPPDLIIRPGDWILGLWWAEMPPGAVPCTPTGSRWFAWVRLDVESAGAGSPVKWHVWNHTRSIGGGDGWCATMVVVTSGADEMNEKMNAHLEALRGFGSALSGGWCPVRGDGAELVRRVEVGAPIPRWLHLVIIASRRLAERSAAG